MNVLIIEDEIHTANLLQQFIELDPEFRVVHKLGSIAEAVVYLADFQNTIDILFFDIQLSDGKSFEIFKHVDITLPVVFCTAYDQYSLEAIKNNGFDYILKPFEETEIHEALQRFKSMARQFQGKASPTEVKQIIQDEFQKVFLSYHRDKTKLLQAEEIGLFCLEQEVVYAYTKDNKKHPLLKTLEYIESVTNPAQYYRINRQMLVSRRIIRSFSPYFNRKLILELAFKTEEKAIVSRLKVSPFKEWLTGPISE